jgi:hypothetical protein
MAGSLSSSDAQLRDAWTDLARLKAAVELAKTDVATARLELAQAHAALADVIRLTRLCALNRLADHRRGQASQ